MTDTVNVAQYVDLKIGVVPVINLEWIQKLHRDKASRGYSTEAVTDTILRRMPDYINYIVPQFSQTDINFQRVPTVDTSNPFVARWIPTPDESMVVIRFRNPHGIDFPVPALDDPQQLHEPRELDRHPGRQARHRHAAHPDADDPQAGRARPASGCARDRQKGLSEMNAMAPRAAVSHAEMANAIRALAMDAVEKAKSGHPGMPMGMADVATVLFTKILKFDPEAAHWPDRDRFVLSAGHGSMLLYALLHLTGYPDMTIDEIKRFRQLGARRPPAILSTATRLASKRQPARSGKGSRQRSAWRSPSERSLRAIPVSSTTTPS